MIDADDTADKLRELRDAWIRFYGEPTERSKGISDAIDIVFGADPASRLPTIRGDHLK